jgi:hypothetical protein
MDFSPLGWYATPGTFEKPDDTVAANSTGADYYRSQGSASGARQQSRRAEKKARLKG